MSRQKENLFSDFRAVSKKEWAEKAREDLKNEDVFEKYNWALEEGLVLQPYYDRGDLTDSAKAFHNRLLIKDNTTGEPREWENIQKIVVSDARIANKTALEALNNGADGVIFDLSKTAAIVPLEELLESILIDYCSISFIFNNNYAAYLEYYNNYVRNKGIDILALKGFIALNHAGQGSFLEVFDQTINYSNIKSIAIRSEKNKASEEVAELLTKAVSHINAIVDTGIDPQQALSNLAVITNISGNYFGEIAKVRAIRQLFFQVARAYGIEDFNPEDLYIHCISPAWTDEKYQPHANMLKATTAAMAAVLGGCNSLTVDPEDYNNPLMVRIARNVSHILKEESYLNKTADPVAGAYFIEVVTDEIAKNAWTMFQKEVARKEEVQK
ncbi:Methylmalonyl-CoA mutase superfamily [Fulvivirga imtechensis AK7]|uniref:Methylmalonyl-CoA mutase superfamily n=1 Tax=Fulvivirga imtechensis AK7 TaxID=1237149 RepID=L8JL74_9BACT|nr:methylmalonyl-CoA mutase family protein [Fulvivirga imtechensis]ELR68157.1 Methylmalonyl-CoA mutase superfamily [Fulvivirga imtechensis AK7]